MAQRKLRIGWPRVYIPTVAKLLTWEMLLWLYEWRKERSFYAGRIASSRLETIKQKQRTCRKRGTLSEKSKKALKRVRARRLRKQNRRVFRFLGF